ncbi:MAG: glycosyltransferase family 2 protein [Janthinobacterium lividum]
MPNINYNVLAFGETNALDSNQDLGPQADPLPTRTDVTKISIVTPCYNEEAGISECFAAVCRVMERDLAGYDYEHVFIDNCSEDSTVAILRDLAGRDRRVKVIVNARNFGPARSPFHAMLECDGAVVIPVLADLQTPPSLIPQMIDLWTQGNKAVLAIKRRTKDSLLLGLARKTFYQMMRKFSKVEQFPNYMGYGLYDQCIIKALRDLNEPEPYFRGLIAEVGFDRAFVEYDQPERRHGRSSYTLFALADYALLGLSSHSRAPLRLMTLVGFSISCVSFMCGIAYLIGKFVFWYSLPVGVAPVLIAIFFLSSVQLFALGIVGEYIGLLLNYARNFPLVIEKERINFD